MSDPRSRKIAVVSDSMLQSALDRLSREGYGIIQLPPAGLDSETTEAWLEQTAEHVAEFHRNDYEIVLVDDGIHAQALTDALGVFGISALPQYAIQPPPTST